jgi:hypothetical protein
LFTGMAADLLSDTPRSHNKLSLRPHAAAALQSGLLHCTPVRLQPCVQWIAMYLCGSRNLYVRPVQKISFTASGLGTEPRPRRATFMQREELVDFAMRQQRMRGGMVELTLQCSTP